MSFKAFTLALVGLSLVVSSAAMAEVYPKEAKDSFLKGCLSTCTPKITKMGIPAAKCNTYCSCSLNSLQQKMTYKEFLSFGEAAAKKQDPPAKQQQILNQVTTACNQTTFTKPASKTN